MQHAFTSSGSTLHRQRRARCRKSRDPLSGEFGRTSVSRVFGRTRRWRALQGRAHHCHTSDGLSGQRAATVRLQGTRRCHGGNRYRRAGGGERVRQGRRAEGERCCLPGVVLWVSVTRLPLAGVLTGVVPDATVYSHPDEIRGTNSVAASGRTRPLDVQVRVQAEWSYGRRCAEAA
jgi:hypothetical protein